MFSSRSVQIAALFSDVFGKALPDLCRSFYNETKAEIFFSVFAVALLAEGVDRNFFKAEDVENYKAHRNDPKPPKPMKPLAPVSATKKQRKKAPKK